MALVYYDLHTSHLYADMDECSYGLNNCTDNADCIDKEGGFDCQCSEGFIGNGFINCSSLYQHSTMLT